MKPKCVFPRAIAALATAPSLWLAFLLAPGPGLTGLVRAADVPPVSAAPLKAASVTSMDALDDKHKLAIGDRLSLRVLEDQEEAKAVLVADSGEVEIPLLGRFPAVDKTPKQLAREIKTELEKEYYYQATVILAVDALTKSRGKVYLMGQIRTAGAQEIPSDEEFTLSKAIMRGGGFSDFADKKHVKVMRQAAGKPAASAPLVFNVAEILEKGRTEKDPKLEPGDIIYVPSRLVNF